MWVIQWKIDPNHFVQQIVYSFTLYLNAGKTIFLLDEYSCTNDLKPITITKKKEIFIQMLRAVHFFVCVFRSKKTVTFAQFRWFIYFQRIE